MPRSRIVPSCRRPPTGDALTSVRAYKRAWETSEALRWLFERPHHFDARLTLKLASFL